MYNNRMKRGKLMGKMKLKWSNKYRMRKSKDNESAQGVNIEYRRRGKIYFFFWGGGDTVSGPIYRPLFPCPLYLIPRRLSTCLAQFIYEVSFWVGGGGGFFD
jgi:hypothetical protein